MGIYPEPDFSDGARCYAGRPAMQPRNSNERESPPAMYPYKAGPATLPSNVPQA